MQTVRVGTRGSILAVTQTDWVIAQLQAMHPHVRFEKTIINTSGDSGDLQPIGAWVSEIEKALLDESIDLAVHSLKDVPTTMPQGLHLAAIPEREDVRDVVISGKGYSLQNLPEGSTIGTSSQRRGFQILSIRPDLQVVPIRGNIQTRINKTMSGEVDAILLALAGLNRAGMADSATEVLSVDTMLPAIGQGALALQSRKSDSAMNSICKSLNHSDTDLAVRAERAFLAGTGGGCRQPMAAYGEVREGRLMLTALLYTPDGKTVGRQDAIGPLDEPEELGAWMARHILQLTADHAR